MNIERWMLARAVSAVFLLATMPASADTGTVIDGSTGKPLPEVFIFATWEADVNKIVESSHVCFKVELTQSDARGAFHISATSGNFDPRLNDRYRYPLLFYKRGYKGPEAEPKEGGTVVMMPDEATGLERLKHINPVFAGT